MTKLTKKTSVVFSLFFVVITVSASCRSAEQNSQSAEPNVGEQVVAKMAKQYAGVRSYQDTGVVQTISSQPNGQAEVDEIIAFKTYFARPIQFRFEWIEDNYPPPNFNIIWSDGRETFTYWEPNPVEKEEDISRGIAGATGVSRGSAHTVSVLLLEVVSGFRLTEMKNISLVREEQFEGEDCFVVRGFHPFGFPIDLWISKNDFLLRKTRERDDETKSWDEEIRRNVKINEAIADEMFHYTPPKTAAEKDSR